MTTKVKQTKPQFDSKPTVPSSKKHLQNKKNIESHK